MTTAIQRTERTKDMWELLSRGMSVGKIAERFDITTETVDAHLKPLCDGKTLQGVHVPALSAIAHTCFALGFSDRQIARVLGVHFTRVWQMRKREDWRQSNPSIFLEVNKSGVLDVDNQGVELGAYSAKRRGEDLSLTNVSGAFYRVPVVNLINHCSLLPQFAQ